VPGAALVGLILLGLYTTQAPLDVLRPRSLLPRPLRVGEEEIIPARLWEDPIKAYERIHPVLGAEGLDLKLELDVPLPSLKGTKAVGLVDHEEEEGETEPRRPSPLPFEGRCLVLPVVVQGGSMADESENRKRTRYAVLSALGQEEFRPIDSRHLGAIRVQGTEGASFVVPFERFAHEEPFTAEAEARLFDLTGAPPPGQVVVLWVPDTILGPEPLTVLHELLEKLEDHVPPGGFRPRYSIIGPTSSQDLVSIVANGRTWAGCEASDDDRCVLQGSVMFSTWGTISDAELEHLVRGELLERGVDLDTGAPTEAPAAADGDIQVRKLYRLGACPLVLERVVETDEVLAEALATELSRRGVQLGQNHIALVAEWDSSYGRSFYSTLTRVIDRRVNPPGTDETINVHELLGRHTYMQGIDGRIPAPPQGATDDDPVMDDSDPERPLGRRQTDYLRRLPMKLAKSERPYDAIGIVATDVYDKLLVLRALRPRFPKAVYFTTDLDVRFLSPEENEWTRNLLVASHFGLDPDEYDEEGRELAKDAELPPDRIGVLPFRDSYQTSNFLAARQAIRSARHVGTDEPMKLHDVGTDVLEARPVRVYEISRTGAHRLDTKGVERPDAWVLACLPALALLSLIFLSSMHLESVPLGPRMLRLTKLFGWVLVPFVLAGLVYPVVYRLEHGRDRLETLATPIAILASVYAVFRFYVFVQRRVSRRRARGGAPDLLEEGFLVVLPSMCFLYIVLGFLIFGSVQRGGGEPMELFEGISVWPAVGIRLFVLGATVWSLHFLSLHLYDRENEIGREFGLDRGRLRSTRLGDLRASLWTVGVDALRRPVRTFLQLPARLAYRWSAAGGDTRGIRSGWKWYRAMGVRRLRRGVRAAVVFTGMALFVYFAEDMHAGLTRGYFARFANGFTWVLALSSVAVLLAFTVDANLLCGRLIRPLGERGVRVVWPRSTRRQLGRLDASESTVDHSGSNYLDPLLDVRLAAEVTDEVSRLVWFPLGLLFLLIVVQNPFFENWSWSWVSAVLFSGGLALLVGSSLYLRRCAEALRESALERLREQALGCKMLDDRGRLDDLDHAIDEVRSMSRGAFLPFAQHPIVAALLLPFGGVGTLALLERLAT
jgi:hypothetical protein